MILLSSASNRITNLKICSLKLIYYYRQRLHIKCIRYVKVLKVFALVQFILVPVWLD